MRQHLPDAVGQHVAALLSMFRGSGVPSDTAPSADSPRPVRARTKALVPRPWGFGGAPRGTAVPLSSGRGVLGDRSPAKFLWYRQRHLSFQRKVGLRGQLLLLFYFTHHDRDRYTCLAHDAVLCDRCAGRYFRPDESTQSPLGRCECAPDPCRPLFRGENLRFSPLPRQATPLFPLREDGSSCAFGRGTGAVRGKRGGAGHTRIPEP